MDSIKGIVKSISEPKDVGKGKPFWVQEIVVESSFVSNKGETYYNPLPISAKGNNLTLLNGIEEGMEVEAEYYVNGREYNKKDGGVGIFVSLDLKGITQVEQPKYSRTGQPMGSQAPPKQDFVPPELEPQEDDLPF
jgi:hypothetical protein